MGTSEKTMFVYDMRNGAAVYQCPLAHHSWGGLAFSPDWRSVACGSLNTVQFFPLPDLLTGAGSGSPGPTVGEQPVPVPQPPARQTDITNSIGMKLVLIPAGKFLMGSPENEVGRFPNEGPQHEVEISQPFYMGQYPVTVGQFRTFARDKNYSWQDPGSTQRENQPVSSVNWNDAVAFCDWLSKKEGKKYRLPTEAEWEYSCRAGTTTAYWFGDDPNKLGEYAWFSGNSGGKTQEVGTKQPNPWGLYDMYGNYMWQWCEDWIKELNRGLGPRGPRRRPPLSSLATVARPTDARAGPWAGSAPAPAFAWCGAWQGDRPRGVAGTKARRIEAPHQRH